ncbi:nuclear transport factor 2 family protein [Streptomyces odontomachi]|uniref:nuclear transport factor 2 family protein n=1 Tax=Streptomyces odontomachi TaxID=2944940 RepID=UPI00210A3006|nr:nuclear transport factor 2 family protein [Streptomyces sp. ODS25]
MPESGGEPAGPREVLARFQQTAIDKSLDAMAELFADDAVLEFPFTRPGIPSRLAGRAEIADFMRANWERSPLRYRAYRNVVVHDTGDPEVVIVEEEATGTAATTGQDFALPHIAVLRVRDGHIVHFRDYVNVLAAAEASGRPLPS